MVVGFTTNCAISVYHHKSWEFKFRSWRGVLNITSCDKVCHWLAAGLWFSPGTLVSSTNKTDCNDITEILLKVAVNTITLTLIIRIILVQTDIILVQTDIILVQTDIILVQTDIILVQTDSILVQTDILICI